MLLRTQRLIVALSTLLGAFILISVATYWSGLKAEKTLNEQHRLLASFPLFKIKSHHYERGWFSSQETTELVFNRKLSGPYETLLPDNLKPLLDSTITYSHTIKHGPLPNINHFDLRPALALVSTEFKMSDSTRETLTRFFGDKKPITITNQLGFGGGGDLSVIIPAFDYDETLSGIKIKWKGLTLNVNYKQGYQEYLSEVTLPGLFLQAATKGDLQFDGIHYESSIHPGKTGVKLGTAELTTDDVSIKWKDVIPYSIKLNELVYLLTRVRVGEFINPSGEFKPSNVRLKGLRYQIVTSEQEEFINSRGKLTFSLFSYNDHHYGPMRLDVSANHLHGPTLIRLDQEIGKIPFEGVEPGELRKQYINTIKTFAIPLLENNPRLLIHEFFLMMPSGIAKLTGTLALNGFKETDLKHPLTFLKRVNAEAKVKLPRQTLEDLVVTQVRNLFTVDETAEDQPNLREVDNLAKQLLDSQLAQWVSEGFIQQEQGQLSTELAFKDGVLTISKKRVSLPWEEDDEPPLPSKPH